MTTSPNPDGDVILTINGGSSSIKFAQFEVGDSLRRTLHGSLENMGQPHARLRAEGMSAADSVRVDEIASRPEDAVAFLVDWISQQLDTTRLRAIGHRVVHGGHVYRKPVRVTRTVLDVLRQLAPCDPDHLPGEIRLIEALMRRFPGTAQVACFDTAFHHGMPRVAQLLPIPRRYETQGVRRYGFHGLSYEFLMDELTRLAGTDVAQGRVVLAHLGSGASLAAVHRGRSLDTSMGFTPASGLVMGTRSGDLDPGVVGYLGRTENMSVQAFDAMVNHRSGLLGLSETSSDIRELLATETRDVRAAEAVAVFCYQVKKCIGAFSAVLGGLDTLVFAGGIGENSAVIRARICENLQFLGIDLDGNRNARGEPIISSALQRVTVRVIHTDEAWVIARAVCREIGIDNELSFARADASHTENGGNTP